MNGATRFDVTVRDQRQYVIGYSVVRKTRCEIYNFVSPTLRILRFTEGSAEWRIDNAIHSFAKGDIVILSNLNKRNIHTIHTDYIAYELFDFYPSCLSSEQLWSVYYSNEHKVSDGDPKIDFLLDCLRDEILRPKDAFQIMGIHSLLNLLTLEFRRSIEHGSDLRFNLALFNIARSLQHISEHLCEELNVRDLAKLCGYTPEYFSRTFKKYIGVSPIQYIISLRLENVMRLVNAEHATIISAAYQSGFQSSSAFYKAFHAYHATSPTKYIEMSKNEEPPKRTGRVELP